MGLGRRESRRFANGSFGDAVELLILWSHASREQYSH